MENMNKEMEEVRQRVLARPSRRSFDLQIDREKIDSESRTVELAFSSELPVERWFGFEILDHKATSARLDRLNNKAALLWNHNRDEQIGVVERAWLGEDKIGRAKVRFSKSDSAQVHFQDVQDGIKSKVSFAYEVNDIVLEKKEGEASTYRVMDWMPYEISMVSIPADDTVGVGREFDEKVENASRIAERLEELIQKANTAPATQSASAGDQKPTTKAQEETIIMSEHKTQPTPEELQALEAQRVAEIEAIGKDYAGRIDGGKEVMDQLVKDAVNLKQPSQDFRGLIFLRVTDNKPLENTGHFLDMSQKEKDRYSISRAIMSLVDPAKYKADFERECSTVIEKRTGQSPKGLWIPSEVRGIRPLTPAQRAEASRIAKIYGMRTLSAGVDTTLVGTEHLASEFIELLRNRAYTLRLGVRILPGLSQNVTIPSQSASATGYWVSTEGNAPTGSEATFSSVALDPKTCGTFTDMTRQLLIQGSPAVDALVQDDLVRVIANTIDTAILHGSDASGQPEGLATVSGTGSVDGAGMGWAGAVEFETDVAAANADVEGMAFLTTAAVRGTLKTREVALNTGKFVCVDNSINGYPVFVSGNVSSGYIFFGDWTQGILGEFGGGADLLVDPYTASSSGTVRIRILQSVDVGFRHAASFSICSNFS